MSNTNIPQPCIPTNIKDTSPNTPLRMLYSAAFQLRETISLAHLITESNIKAYVQPVILFAMLSVASGGVTTNSHPTYNELINAFLHTAVYIWLYVLYFDCSNQKDPESIKEDKLNKPWRAIPSGRLSIEGAERWYVVASCLLLLASSTWLGGFPEAVAFMIETWVYDYASGANFWWGKNLINALFYMTGQLGGTRVAARAMGSTSITRASYEWCILLGINTFTTVQIQDLRDQEGDKIRGRRTMALALGDGTTRWITALFISFWSIVCPAYWGNGHFTMGYILPPLIGITVSARVLSNRSVKADRSTFHYYTLLWLPALYSIPLLSKYQLLWLF
ncbi:UbiA prenyltransferase family-domain-containing protein [Xylogone sp. PMI_703]|nr:UbiA prenyltransferase family-domain-containing protein [Xylogone sp. PMI_703]